MSQRISKVAAFLGLITIVVIILTVRFPDFFEKPNHVIEPYADGFKAYTTIEYHAKYDSTYSFYTGMQYPYKEHVIPAATQPLLSNFIRFVHRNITPIADHTNAIVNFSLLTSILLAIIFLYLIFLKLKLPIVYAMGISIGIVFLGPQFERLIGHYGLAHMEVIPCLIYLLMRYDERSSIGRSIAIMCVVLAFSLIHFYFFAIQVFMITGYFFFRFIFEKKNWKVVLKQGVDYSIQVLIPLVFFLTWMKMGEEITDRTNEPYGFLTYLAQPQGVFYSQFQPYFEWIGVSKWKLENRAYIGLFALLGGVSIILYYFLGLFKRPFLNWGTAYDQFFTRLFSTAIIILLFSFGVPFVWESTSFLLEYAGPLRQFRSIGRFAWVFYYIINILAFASFYYFVVEKYKKTKWRMLWLILPIAFVNYEAYNQTWNLNLKLNSIRSATRVGHTYLDVPNINYNDYQAIISLPNFSIGSDNFWRHPDGAVAQESQVLSIQTGLPLMAAMLTRTSLSNTIKQLQFTAEPYRIPALLNDINDDRPFLIVTSKVGLKKMAKKGFIYDHLLADATFLFEKNENEEVYSLPLKSFYERVERKANRVRDDLAQKDTLFQKGDLLVSDSLSYTYYEPFIGLKGEAYHGDNGYLGSAFGENIIFEKVIPTGAYDFSGWFYFQKDLIPTTVLILTVKKEDGSLLYKIAKSAADVVVTFDNNGWGLLSVPFSIQEENSTLTIHFSNNKPALKHAAIGFDELLIRAQNNNVYFDDSTWMMKNNRWFKK